MGSMVFMIHPFRVLLDGVCAGHTVFGSIPIDALLGKGGFGGTTGIVAKSFCRI